MDYDYLVTGETVKLRENGATSGVGVLATLAYDDLGRRTGLTFGNGASQAYSYDPVSRLATLTNDLASTANDLSQTFAYNPASQIASTVRTGDAYAWTGHFNENKTGTANGLNQLTQVGAKTLTHDARGNVTAFGTKSFTYSSENLLLTGPSSSTLSYDPTMRLQQIVSGGSTTKLAYDGLDRIAEYDASSTLLRRYVHGPNMDEPFVWYEGTSTTDRRFLGSDERGSIISVTDGSGTVLGLNRYDEYGNPQSTNLGTWGYTGQAWLQSISIWYYKARDYDPELGRFLQPDPIGYADSPNLYPYVLNDPVNSIDPLGLLCTVVGERGCLVETVTGKRPEPGSGCGVECSGGYFHPNPGSAPPSSSPGREPGEMPTEEDSESEACKILQARGEKGKGALPPHVTNTNNWSNLSTLTGYRNYYQSNANQWSSLTNRPAQYLMLGISLLPWVRAGKAVYGVGGAAGTGVAGIETSRFIQNQLELNTNRVKQIDERIDQLRAGC